MLITIIDDEALALKSTESAVREALPGAEIHSFGRGEELLSFAAGKRIDIAFLDINMRGLSGLELAEKLEMLIPKINIVFVTAFDDYKSEAMDLHASGYLMKPVLAEDIQNEIKYLRFPVSVKKTVSVRCFGNFSVTVNGSVPDFQYSKTTELFAYLIDRQGAMVTNNELSAVLWEDDSHFSYLKRLRADLKNTFEKAGCGDIILSKTGSIGVDLSKISCDYTDYLNGSSDAEAMFHGEYMRQYSWAEVTLANLLTDF